MTNVDVVSPKCRLITLIVIAFSVSVRVSAVGSQFQLIQLSFQPNRSQVFWSLLTRPFFAPLPIYGSFSRLLYNGFHSQVKRKFALFKASQACYNGLQQADFW